MCLTWSRGPYFYRLGFGGGAPITMQASGGTGRITWTSSRSPLSSLLPRIVFSMSLGGGFALLARARRIKVYKHESNIEAALALWVTRKKLNFLLSGARQIFKVK